MRPRLSMDDVSMEEGNNIISASEDFAEIYLFLATFGPYMNFPRINLIDLENFFRTVPWIEEDHLVYIAWRLLRYAGRNGRQNEWKNMTVKYGRKIGLLSDSILYQDIGLKTRMKIFRLLCEQQFDCNRNILSHVNREMLTRPIGVDRDGLRYWLLQDSMFDIRFYSEGNYDEAPPTSSNWILLAWTLDTFADLISILDSRISPSKSADSGITTSPFPVTSDIERPSHTPPSSPSPSPPTHRGSDIQSMEGRKRQASRKIETLPKKKAGGDQTKPIQDEEVEGESEGCLKCCRDMDYDQMLLCDMCDRECHTYCQYPVLWAVPKGKWVCPICKEEELVIALREIYLRLSQGKFRYKKQIQRKEQSVARLQKSGLLVQNIILDDEMEGKRVRRNRKAINYAELNDVYLPPLGPRDVVGGTERPLSMRKKREKRTVDCYIQEDYLAPRARNSSRRFLASRVNPILDTVEEKEREEEDCTLGDNNLGVLSSDDDNNNDDGLYSSRIPSGTDSVSDPDDGASGKEVELSCLSGTRPPLFRERSHDGNECGVCMEEEKDPVTMSGLGDKDIGSSQTDKCIESTGIDGFAIHEYAPINTRTPVKLLPPV